MVRGQESEKIIMLYYVTLAIALLLGATLAIFSPRLKSIPEGIETVVHELGHVIAGLPWFTTLPRRTTFFNLEEAQVNTSAFPIPLSNFFTTLSGYTSPIVIGLGLIFTPMVGEIPLTLPFFLAVVFFVLMSITPLWLVFTVILRALFTFAFWVCLLLTLVISPDEFGDRVETLSGAQLCLSFLVFMCCILLWGNAFNAFTIWRKEALVSTAIVTVSVGGVALLWFAPYELQLFVLALLGSLLLVSGFKTLFVKHRENGGDFHIIAEDSRLIRSPKAWWVICISVLLPFQLACLAVFEIFIVWRAF